MISRAGLLACLVLRLNCVDAAALQAPASLPSDVTVAVRALLPAARDRVLGAMSHVERAERAALYQSGGGAPLWVDPDGRPTSLADEALALVADAEADGLDPADYGAAALAARAAALAGSPSTRSSQDIAEFDAGLSLAMLRFFRHLHLGRVDPRAAGFRMSLPAEGHDFVLLLSDAIARRRIGEAARELWPPLAQYRALREMLPKYRALSADPSFLPWPGAQTPVRHGATWPGLQALHQRLVRLGDLPADTPAPAEGATDDGAIVEGVQRFQDRHGLEPDGVIGRSTHAALRVPLAWRVRQIELALERLRWLPDLGAERLIILNIPMFRLWAFDAVGTTPPSLTMRAIVGKALHTRTPVFVEQMEHLIFRPYWNIPRSILHGEILPALADEPDYLRRQNMELVGGESDEASPVPATGENLALLSEGKLRLRQRPGENNALGRVKFVFPNDDNVYLHDTPAHALFGRTRRDFSHGCVRVEDPEALAAWALQGQPGWSSEAVLEAMEGAPSRRVRLERPIQVILFYVTAVVFSEDNAVHFAEDIYGHDARLDRVLGS